MNDSMVENAINWRNIGVKRERYHEALIARLTLEDRSIFQYLKDLMVFAAMVGYSKCERKPLKGETIEIILDTYASDEKDGFIYLLGLMEFEDGQVLKDERLKDCVGVFEEYCNAGLYTIESWLDENPGDPNGVETLLNNIYLRLAENEKESPINNDDIEVDVQRKAFSNRLQKANAETALAKVWGLGLELIYGMQGSPWPVHIDRQYQLALRRVEADLFLFLPAFLLNGARDPL